MNHYSKIFLTLGVIATILSYFISFAVGSNNKGILVESFNAFIQKMPNSKEQFHEHDSLCIISFFEIKKSWIEELEFKSFTRVILADEITNNFPCDKPGFVVLPKVNLGIIKIVKFSNLPCKDMIVFDAVMIWTGISWKIIISQLAGMA